MILLALWMKMEEKYQHVANELESLRKDFREKRISRTDFIQRLKSLRLKDGEGRFWMIGIQSGKWYYYDGERWIQSNPPSLQEGKAICIHCGFENRLEAAVCVRCGENLIENEVFCPDCGRKLEAPGLPCPDCREGKFPEKSLDLPQEDKEGAHVVFRSLHPVSFLYFMAALGIFFGIIVGAFSGTTGVFSAVIQRMPAFLREIQGTIVGGIIYAGLGGIAGLFVLGLFGYLLALLINLISSFVGGIKIRLD